MLLVTDPATLFLQFTQILCWIVLPLLIAIVTVTIFLHYRRRKRAGNGDNVESFLKASPERVGYTTGNGEFILFDHSRMLIEYKDRLSYNHARFTALQKDFAAMQVKYRALAGDHQNRLSLIKNQKMENPFEPMHVSLNQATVDDDWTGKSTESVKLVQTLEQENRLLREQLSMTNVGDEERKNIIGRWVEENTALREKVAEQEYLQDILNEKNAVIAFLQAQVEQRVKAQHTAEQQKLKILSETEDLRRQNREAGEKLESLANELSLKIEESGNIQGLLRAKDGQLEEKKRALSDQAGQLVYFENALRETKTQNEMLNAELADKKDLVNALQQQLQTEQSRTLSLEQKLAFRKQLMQKLYKEFSSCMDEDNERSPVIALNPGYGNPQNGEANFQ